MSLWTAMGLPEPETEYRFHPERKWRFDYSFPSYKIAIEIEGGLWTRGRHIRAQGYIEDMQKYNEAMIMGWMVLRFTPAQLATGQVYIDAKRAIHVRNTPG